MLKLPPVFQFSATSLQDFLDCPRRFQLRYLWEQEWPAPVAEPLGDLERADSLGRRFHLLLERHWLGLPVERERIDPALLPWWEAFLAHPPALPGAVRRPEVHTSALVHGQRAVGTFDLLAYDPGGPVAIVDWKTMRRRPSRRWLEHRMQTLVYPLLLVDSAERLLGYALKPGDVRLVYWFAAAPAAVEVFEYSESTYQNGQRALASLLDRLLNMPESGEWPLTEDMRLCQWCQYRSLCDRGRVAGNLDDEFEDSALDTTAVPTAPTAGDDYVL